MPLSKKHLLTQSKKEIEPSSKRHARERCILRPIEIMHASSPAQYSHSSSRLRSPKKLVGELSTKTVKMSGFSVKQCRKKLTELIEESYEESNDKKDYVTQEATMKELELTIDNINRLSRAVAEIFPNSTKERHQLSSGDGQRKIVCSKVKKEREHHIATEEGEMKLIFPENSGVDHIKTISRLQSEQSTLFEKIEAELDKPKEEWRENYLKLLIKKVEANKEDITKYSDGLVRLYEKEIIRLSKEEKEHKLSRRCKDEIENEMKEAHEMLNLGLRTETDIDLKGSAFADLSKKLKDQCPLIYEILENLFLTAQEGKTVSSGKRVHSATHALAILCSLKSQLMTNDLKTLFTLLCISLVLECALLA